MFSEKTGISYKYYQAVEEGRKGDLRLSTLERLADAYGLQVFELLSPQLPIPRMKPEPKAKKKRRSGGAPAKKATLDGSLVDGQTTAKANLPSSQRTAEK